MQWKIDFEKLSFRYETRDKSARFVLPALSSRGDDIFCHTLRLWRSDLARFRARRLLFVMKLYPLVELISTKNQMAIAERLKLNPTLYFFPNLKPRLTPFVHLNSISKTEKTFGKFVSFWETNLPTKTKNFLCDFFLFFSPPKFWKNGKENFCFGFGLIASIECLEILTACPPN
ncbi:MAG: hypothetical protein KAV41_03355 [Candidatus Pacebacteria bacterium]|nr:hypothetical protein [Candidatus Paceibacterota bacterium]